MRFAIKMLTFISSLFFYNCSIIYYDLWKLMLFIIQKITHNITGAASKYECRINRVIYAKKNINPYSFSN